MRDSANDAFFTAESLENLSEALIREGIQNSLDAAERGPMNEREVRIRISFIPNASLETKKAMSSLFKPTKDHFEKGLLNGSFDDIFDAQVGFLAFEDFGTKGLDGDAGEWRLEQAEGSAFFSFFRAEGRSAKTGENLGRWGIGKQVFPTASRLHSMFGLSIRSDAPREVLMGSAVVCTHSIAGQDYQPDAWFGSRTGHAQVMPVTDAAFIEFFRKTFGLIRDRELGLSVVVPCVDERVNVDDLRRGIVRNFFWPILLGELVVDLEGPGGPWRIDAESLPTHRALLLPPEAAVVEFALWASTARPAGIVTLDEGAATRPYWHTVGTALLTEAKLTEIRALLEANQKVGVKIPVRVRPKARGHEETRPEAMSFFTVFIAPCRDTGYRPIFLRDGIVIKDVRAPRLQGSRSLVVVENRPLAGLFGDAEGVNHTQWQKDLPKSHNHYVYGTDTSDLTSPSVYEITRTRHAAEAKDDLNLLTDNPHLPVEQRLRRRELDRNSSLN